MRVELLRHYRWPLLFSPLLASSIFIGPHVASILAKRLSGKQARRYLPRKNGDRLIARTANNPKSPEQEPLLWRRSISVPFHPGSRNCVASYPIICLRSNTWLTAIIHSACRDARRIDAIESFVICICGGRALSL